MGQKLNTCWINEIIRRSNLDTGKIAGQAERVS